MTKRALDIGHGSGDPAGFPGYKPVNPWGRAMPKPKRAYRQKPIREELFQVVMEYRDGRREPLGPAANQDFIGTLAEGINAQIALGKGGEYGVAHVVPVKPAAEQDTRTIGEIIRSGL